MSRFEQRKRVRAFRCRCRKCEHRVYMTAHPDTFARGLRCESCGHRERDRGQGWRVDWYRTSKAEAKRQGVCECLYLPFPHRPASSYKSSRCDYLMTRPIRRAERQRVAA